MSALLTWARMAKVVCGEYGLGFLRIMVGLPVFFGIRLGLRLIPIMRNTPFMTTNTKEFSKSLCCKPGEYEGLHELNMLARCAEVAWDNGADLEVVDDWIASACGSTPAIEGLCNLLLQADEISYYEYSCKGSVLEESFEKSWWFECMADRSEYSQVWRPCAQVGRSLLTAKVTDCSQRRSLSATLAFEQVSAIRQHRSCRSIRACSRCLRSARRRYARCGP